MSSIFSQEIVNNDRQHVFDLCKALCVIGMIFSHIFYILDMNSSAMLSTGWIQDVGRLFGAQLFMFSMGIGMVYTKNNSHKAFFKRGFILFITGYLLNFLRETLPWLIVGQSPFTATGMNEFYLSFLCGDILQFAGLAFLFIGGMKLLKISNIKMLFVTLFITLLGAYCSDKFNVQLEVANSYFLLLGLLVPIKNLIANEYVAFCFCNWLIYPVLGFLFGEILQHCYNKEKFYLRLLKFSSALIVLAILAFKFFLEKDLIMNLTQREAYYQQPIDLLPMYLLFLLFGVSLFFFVSRVFVGTHIWRVVKYLSKELPFLYIISWVLIGWIGAIFRFYNLNFACDYKNILLLFVVVMVLSEICVSIKNNIFKKGIY